MNEKLQIAIDGPASAGKSTVAKLVATKLGYIYCDTGAMYRAVTFAARKKGIPFDDNQKLSELMKEIQITFLPGENEQKVFVNDEEVTQAIRQPEITNNVSAVAAQPSVRESLTNRQQEIAAQGGIVMDGRDIGTTVLPNAQVKIFLIASVHQRAVRRFKENQEKGINTPLEVLEEEIKLRDYKDSHREISPLTKAADAIELDTTSLTIEEVVNQIMKIAKK
ncbi:cytidylate kinase [Ligilactobacillus hayakitensis DSM 18933 = JCM 14209]|uniref:Cytidylate kinase n=1 Tax=Ligilactobacillus hayakitensis DSM 18933 = JCM 14209 TaxID=1423755 RepID=A0A0R1WMD0_9LACO|nr:(d)CMP kinase [Ligilactobacillus hayakitensis]KRM18958.1 cytidylate kinase [Ligilactobacillus hayakitensis DSM 18933 = JCM 14209]